MLVCPFCNMPIPEDIEVCSICWSSVSAEKVEEVGITATCKDTKEWQRYKTFCAYLCLALFVFGITLILLNSPLWFTIFSFILSVFCLAVVLYSHRKVTDLKRRFWDSENDADQA